MGIGRVGGARFGVDTGLKACNMACDDRCRERFVSVPLGVFVG